MLQRIRAALGQGPAPGSVRRASAEFPTLAPEAILPPIPDLLAKFEEEMQRVAGQCHQATGRQELETVIGAILKVSGTTEVVLSRNPLLKQLDLAARLKDAGLVVVAYEPGSSGPAGDPGSVEGGKAFREHCFSAGAGITGVDFALAESGSLVLTSDTEGSQLASLAPPVHIALYRRRQLVAYLEQVLEALPLGQNPGDPDAGRSVVLVTGPSRTADIEQILVRGVHGPRDVHAILVEDSCLTPAPG